MKRMLVVVVDSEAVAHEASRALEGLAEQSVIALHAASVIATTDAGAPVVRRLRADPQGTMGGTAVGGLAGMFGGPVSAALGAAVGFLLGVTTDFARAHVEGAFATEVAHGLEPGQAALVAEIDEESTAAVDERMRSLGGLPFRRALSEVADAESEQAIASFKGRIARVTSKLVRRFRSALS
jgi:uncharacterized membrane protein